MLYLQIINIRLPSENGSQKGFGYIEVEDRESLISILKCNGSVSLQLIVTQATKLSYN